MSSTMLRLKRPSGWFAAGREVERALMLLSDAAFRLFLWFCLHADRRTGSLPFSVEALAGVLQRTAPEIRNALDELSHHGTCHAIHDRIEIADSFWPYHRTASSNADNELAAYVAQVKHCFLQRRCVRSSFTAADEGLAAELYRSRFPVADAEHAILLGAIRKYASWE